MFFNKSQNLVSSFLKQNFSFLITTGNNSITNEKKIDDTITPAKIFGDDQLSDFEDDSIIQRNAKTSNRIMRIKRLQNERDKMYKKFQEKQKIRYEKSLARLVIYDTWGLADQEYFTVQFKVSYFLPLIKIVVVTILNSQINSIHL